MNDTRLVKKQVIEGIHVKTSRTKTHESMNDTLGQNEVLVFYGIRAELNDLDWLPKHSEHEFHTTEQISGSKNKDLFSTIVLKRLLSHYSGINENEITFKYGKNGKPFLLENDKLQFNCSHSEEMLVIALTLGAELGIDVESLTRIVQPAKLQTYLFTPIELSLFNALEETHQQEAFIDSWTQKEALLKATGEGLTRPMNTIELSRINHETTINWYTESTTLLDQYRVAIAVQGEINSVTYIPLREAEWLTNNLAL